MTELNNDAIHRELASRTGEVAAMIVDKRGKTT
jgi:hypothetical protein